jgi:GNAT superfamily N-acetyltransferase
MAVSTRLACATDVSDIARLTLQIGYNITASEALERLTRILGRLDHGLFVAERDGRLVGWIHVVIQESVEAEKSVEIAGIVVDSAQRLQGTGRMLMEVAEEWARRSGCTIVRLRSTSGRHAAHRFYEHLGYTNLKTQYSFIKSLDGAGASLTRFVPKLETRL